MSKALSKTLESLTGENKSQVEPSSEYNHLSLDDLSNILLSVLMDQGLEESRVRSFFWSMVEAYVERFQVFPFDAGRALTSYLELHEYPEEQLRDLVKQLEKLYIKQHGRPLRESVQQPADGDAGPQSLDDEISALRETLKYAAIAGERLDGKE
jgi:hypothetical protein